MKNALLLLLIPVLLYSCKNTEQKAGDTPEASKVPVISKNSAAFNESFQSLLSSYYALKDALIESDTVKANTASRQLAAFADNLQVTGTASDAAGNIQQTAKNYTGTIKGSALGLASEAGLLQKKKAFQQISEAMYDLVRTVKYDREIIYHQHCPMAFNDNEEAYWLSNKSIIENPYLGKKHPKYRDAMLHCGDITDSLDFTK